jgi:hypothetical protein
LHHDSDEFASLSASHTSNAKDFRLLDESISLSSVVQLSGYPSVVATMWQVSDELSLEVANDRQRQIVHYSFGRRGAPSGACFIGKNAYCDWFREARSVRSVGLDAVYTCRGLNLLQ